MRHSTRTAVLLVLFATLLIKIGAQTNATEKAKEGWNLGLLPAITFDSDLGFQYGGLVNIFNYGDGSRYPAYNQSIYLEASKFTKGSTTLRFFYDSDQLLSGLKLTADVSYLTNQLSTFYGFNGYKAIYNENFMKKESESYISKFFYNYDEKLFRTKIDLFGNIGETNIEWSTGVTYYNYSVAEVDLEKLNSGKNENDKELPFESLLTKYSRWGFISNKEADGGYATYIKMGLAYDTRDRKALPTKGFWSELIVRTAPAFLSEGKTHTKLSLYHRQYFTIVPNNTFFAYRLNYQTSLFDGSTPYYLQPIMGTSFLTGSSSNGLGGNKSLRGILRKRVVGDGYAMANIELRQIFLRFNKFKQNFYIGTNLFFDCGLVTKNISLSTSNLSNNEKEELTLYYGKEKESLHKSAGLGLKLAMNQNFVVSFDYGKALDDRDGNSGFYMTMNYLF